MTFYEVWEYYEYGTKKKRFRELKYDHTGGLKKYASPENGLPKSYGVSYLYIRECLKSYGEKMGLDKLLEEEKCV